MKLIREHIIVKVPSIFFDETKYKGVNGQTIVMNVFFNPVDHVRNFGEVVEIPFELLAMPIAQDPIGWPSYHENPPYNWKTTQDIELDIKVGDRVYFHYNCLLPDAGMNTFNNYQVYSKKEDGVWYHYFRVKYQLVFAAVRYEKCNAGTQDFNWSMEAGLQKTVIKNQDYYVSGDNTYRKQVSMIGSYCFVEADKETWEDISIPIPETVNGQILLDKNGRPVLKPKEQWLVTKQQPGDVYLRGWVRYVGNPLRGDELELQEGMYVHFRPLTNTRIIFEGEEYFRMLQRHIGVWEPHKSQLKTNFNYETA